MWLEGKERDWKGGEIVSHFGPSNHDDGSAGTEFSEALAENGLPRDPKAYLIPSFLLIFPAFHLYLLLPLFYGDGQLLNPGTDV